LTILIGYMSLVGPPQQVPYNQVYLIKLRTFRELHVLKPRLSVWAKLHGQDERPIQSKVVLVAEHLTPPSLTVGLRIISLISVQMFQRQGVPH